MFKLSAPLSHRTFSLLLALALLISGCAGARRAPAADSAQPNPTAPPPARPWFAQLFSVGGYALYMWCAGEGSPTVIFESALGHDTANWFKVAPEIAASTRVCAYNRAGVAGSESAGPGARTSLDVAADLHALLAAAGIAPPYVLVGHSIGGWHTRVFASQYPAEVAGLVLIDSAHPDMAERQLAALPAEQMDEPLSVRKFRNAMQELVANPAVNAEHLDFSGSADEVRAAGALGDLPLAVVTANPTEELGLPPGVEAGVNQAWQAMQADLAALSTNSLHLQATTGGHFVQIDQPELVVQAVDTVLKEAREPKASN